MIKDILPAAAQRLAAVSDSPRLDAEVLLAHLLGCDRSALLAQARDAIDPERAGQYDQMLRQRGDGVPLAYLTGAREFWSLSLEVTPDVLVPRPETELLVEWGLERIAGRRAPRILDLGTGSGCIALALAHERRDADVIAIDASAAALAVARRNAQRLALTNVRFLDHSFADLKLDAPAHLVISNPPYVAEDDPHLRDLACEPRAALVAGADGLGCLREISTRARSWLEPGGALLLEHGAGQGAAVRELLVRAGFDNVETRRDLAGLERATGGQA